MFVLPIANETNQAFSFDADFYSTTLVLKCPNNNCGPNTSYPPIVDIFVGGYPPVYGLPLINGIDILSERVSSGCLPFDYGAIIPLSNDDSEITCESLITGRSALVYLNAAEVLFSSLVLP